MLKIGKVECFKQVITQFTKDLKNKQVATCRIIIKSKGKHNLVLQKSHFVICAIQFLNTNGKLRQESVLLSF